jgi:hypothetical protein
MLKSRPKVVFIKKLLNIDTQKPLYIYNDRIEKGDPL